MTNAAEHADLCPGCFTDKGTASLCPHCGYDESLKRGPLVLPHRTLLHHGQYLIGKVLGKPGGFGITYLALDTKLQTRVAIKEYLPRDLAGRDAGHATISAHSAEDGEFLRYGLTQFLQEARTLAQFDHANIVRVRNFFEENGTGYLVMDYYDGITLADYLAQQPQGRLPEKTAVAILMPILDGLREVHAKNILHRDIKPHNIYLTTANRPILLDFGAARQAMGERSRSLSVVLSEGYAPYEQYHRRGEQGPWTDIYACAAVLYHAVSGQAPPPATERMHKDELDIAALGVSATLAEALRLGLATDHHKRPQRMTEFQALLLGGGEPTGKTEVEQKPKKIDLPAPATIMAQSPIESTQSKSQSSKKIWWAVGLAVVVVIAMVATGSKEEKKTVPTADTPVSVAPVAKTEQDKAPTTVTPTTAASEDKIQPDKAPPTPAAPVTSASEAAETALWKSVENSTNTEGYDSYLKQYPKGKYVALAKVRLKKLEEEAAQQASQERAEITQQARLEREAAAREEAERQRQQAEAAQAKQKQEADRQRQQAEDAQIAAIGLAMIRIPGKNYEIGKYEVTQAEWRAVMGVNRSGFSNCGDTCPVEHVSWNDAQAFIQKLNAKTGKQYRLPTEAEWEYACYGGSQTEYCGGNNLNSVAWTNGSGSQTHPVGQKQANGYGLYDMSGNVWEWMNECWKGDCTKHTVRGGSYFSFNSMFSNSPPSASHREGFETVGTYNGGGFRLARTLP